MKWSNYLKDKNYQSSLKKVSLYICYRNVVKTFFPKKTPGPDGFSFTGELNQTF